MHFKGANFSFNFICNRSERGTGKFIRAQDVYEGGCAGLPQEHSAYKPGVLQYPGSSWISILRPIKLAWKVWSWIFYFQLVILSAILQKPDKHIFFLDVKMYLIRVNEMIIS